MICCTSNEDDDEDEDDDDDDDEDDDDDDDDDEEEEEEEEEASRLLRKRLTKSLNAVKFDASARKARCLASVVQCCSSVHPVNCTLQHSQKPPIIVRLAGAALPVAARPGPPCFACPVPTVLLELAARSFGEALPLPGSSSPSSALLPTPSLAPPADRQIASGSCECCRRRCCCSCGSSVALPGASLSAAAGQWLGGTKKDTPAGASLCTRHHSSFAGGKLFARSSKRPSRSRMRMRLTSARAWGRHPN